MMIQSFLVRGAGAAVASRLATLSPTTPLDALVLFSLGADHSVLVDAVKGNKVNCPVYLTETYGIIGFDDKSGRNVELMEKGRGSEYGYAGGSGGQGCLVVGYAGGDVTSGHGSLDGLPETATSCMVVADQSGGWAKVKDHAPVHYGGITKKCFQVTADGALREIPYFWVASTATSPPVGVTTFSGDATEAMKSLLEKVPTGFRTTGSVGLFPCFTRGVNHYGAEDVESSAIDSVWKKQITNSKPTTQLVRVYGMFAHGELGPDNDYADFTQVPVNSKSKDKIPCSQHGMTTILAVHTTTNAAETCDS